MHSSEDSPIPPPELNEGQLADIQGLLRHGYPYFDAAAYCLFEIEDPAGMRRWLGRLLDPRERWIDNARLRASTLRNDDCGVAIAFTRHGLERLGLDAGDMRTFVTEFQEGMVAPHRSRLLGDVEANDPRTWEWGRTEHEAWMDGLLIVFAPVRQLDASLAEIRAIEGRPRFRFQINSARRPNAHGLVEEPFGFADGISQPVIRGLTRKPAPPGVRPVRPGEFVLGYENEFRRFPASPSLAPGRNSRAKPLPLNALGRADFGRSGSYLVVRQLEQDVAAFRGFVGNDGHFAARLVGRWRSGAPLARYPDTEPRRMSQRELEAENGFGYHREDRHGLRCPIGAHIRRANPRDSLADGLGISRERAQELVDQHRILRRGRGYETHGRQGLMFLCLNANIERQFEFVQSSWLLHPEFGGLSGETDPILGVEGRAHDFTIQHTVLGERRTGLPQFVVVRGGAYFFLPGLQALRYLSDPAP